MNDERQRWPEDYDDGSSRRLATIPVSTFHSKNGSRFPVTLYYRDAAPIKAGLDPTMTVQELEELAQTSFGLLHSIELCWKEDNEEPPRKDQKVATFLRNWDAVYFESEKQNEPTPWTQQGQLDESSTDHVAPAARLQESPRIVVEEEVLPANQTVTESTLSREDNEASMLPDSLKFPFMNSRPSQLHMAIAQGDPEEVDVALALAVTEGTLNQVDADGLTAFDIAVLTGQEKIVKQIEEHGGETHYFQSKPNDMKKILHQASQDPELHRRSVLARYLSIDDSDCPEPIPWGAAMDTPSVPHDTDDAPDHVAPAARQQESPRIVVEEEVLPANQTVTESTLSREDNEASMLPDSLKFPFMNSRPSQLHMAIAQGDPEEVDVALALAVTEGTLNQVDVDGLTAFDIAVLTGQEKIVKQIEEHGGETHYFQSKPNDMKKILHQASQDPELHRRSLLARYLSIDDSDHPEPILWGAAIDTPSVPRDTDDAPATAPPALHLAIAAGDKNMVQQELDMALSKDSVNALDNKGRTALDVAALSGQKGLFQLVYDYGGQCAYFTSDEQMNAVMEYSSINPEANRLRIWTDYVGSSNYSTFSDNMTCLSSSLTNRRQDIFPAAAAPTGRQNELSADTVLSGYDADRLPLHTAIRDGDQGRFIMLLRDVACDLNEVDSRGRSPLDYAAFCGRRGMFKALLEFGARPSKMPSVKSLWIMLCQREPHAKNPSPSPSPAPSQRQERAASDKKRLREAVFLNAAEFALLGSLKSADRFTALREIDVNVRCPYTKETALHKAVHRGHKTIVEYLLTLDKIDVNARDIEGRTPLHYAVRRLDRAMVECLLRQGGANPNVMDARRCIPIDELRLQDEMAPTCKADEEPNLSASDEAADIFRDEDSQAVSQEGTYSQDATSLDGATLVTSTTASSNVSDDRSLEVGRNEKEEHHKETQETSRASKRNGIKPKARCCGLLCCLEYLCWWKHVKRSTSTGVSGKDILSPVPSSKAPPPIAAIQEKAPPSSNKTPDTNQIIHDLLIDWNSFPRKRFFLCLLNPGKVRDISAWLERLACTFEAPYDCKIFFSVLTVCVAFGLLSRRDAREMTLGAVTDCVQCCRTQEGVDVLISVLKHAQRTEMVSLEDLGIVQSVLVSFPVTKDVGKPSFRKSVTKRTGGVKGMDGKASSIRECLQKFLAASESATCTGNASDIVDAVVAISSAFLNGLLVNGDNGIAEESLGSALYLLDEKSTSEFLTSEKGRPATHNRSTPKTMHAYKMGDISEDEATIGWTVLSICRTAVKIKAVELRGLITDAVPQRPLSRMQRRDYDDPLLDRALHNYESFHGMVHGTATIDAVDCSSAGIQGWASCHLDTNGAIRSDGSATNAADVEKLPRDQVSRRFVQISRHERHCRHASDDWSTRAVCGHRHHRPISVKFSKITSCAAGSLHWAVADGDYERVRDALTKAGELGSVNVVDGKNRTALDVAALTGQKHIFKLIEDQGGRGEFFRVYEQMKSVLEYCSLDPEGHRIRVWRSYRAHCLHDADYADYPFSMKDPE